MKKIIAEAWLAVDGFAAGENGDLSFAPGSKTGRYSHQHQLQL